MSLTLDDPTIPFLEHDFAAKLSRYMTFMRDCLGVDSRITVTLGLSGVAGMAMWPPPLAAGRQYTGFARKWGTSVGDEIVVNVEGVSLVVPDEVGLEYPEHTPYVFEDASVAYAYKTLVPFYEELFSHIQIKRPKFLPS